MTNQKNQEQLSVQLYLSVSMSHSCTPCRLSVACRLFDHINDLQTSAIQHTHSSLERRFKVNVLGRVGEMSKHLCCILSRTLIK